MHANTNPMESMTSTAAAATAVSPANGPFYNEKDFTWRDFKMQTRQTILSSAIIGLALIVVWLGRGTIAQTLRYESSPIDWCEENYAYHPWIVEFWNSVSSFLLSFFGVLGLVVYRRDAKLYKFEPTMTLVWVMMIVVGLGSVWFHSTLSVAGQISDEVPIVILCLVVILMSRSNAMPYRNTLLNGHMIARGSVWLFTFCLFFPELSHVIVVIFLPIGVLVFSRDYRLYGAQQPLFRTLFWLTNASFYLALFVWILDRTACDAVTQWGKKYLGFYPQLHAIWHVFIGLTFWLVICLFIMMKAWRERGLKSSLKPGQFFVVDIGELESSKLQEEEEEQGKVLDLA